MKSAEGANVVARVKREMRIGTAEIFADNLRDACVKLNETRADIDPRWIIQISPPNPNGYGIWIVVYRWEE